MVEILGTRITPDNITKLEKIKFLFSARIIDTYIKELNIHYAKVHFTQDEINDIRSMIEEAKKFI